MNPNLWRPSYKEG